jgi:hypothetical protein
VTSASSDYTLTSAGIVPTTNAVSDLGSAPLRYSALYVYAIEALGNANVSGNGIFGGNGSFSGTFFVAGTTILNAQTTINGALLPNTNNTFDQGTSGNRWRDIYSNSLNTSASISVGTNANVTGTVTSTSISTGAVTASGALSAASLTTAGLLISGSVSTGSVTTDNVAIKHKKFTGTTSGAGVFNATHGLTASKILSVSGKIRDAISGLDLSVVATAGGLQSRLSHDSTQVTIAIEGPGINTASQAATILVTYEA